MTVASNEIQLLMLRNSIGKMALMHMNAIGGQL
jgi:hypothetical protein